MENRTQLNFFVVDDDLFWSSMYEQFLTNLGYLNITYYHNGMDCLDNLDKKPDIIFLDHNMDDINGFEVLKKIKNYNPNIYVIMVSGQGTIKTAVDALQYGAFDYIIKNNAVCDKMGMIINKIIVAKGVLKKTNQNFIQKILCKFKL
jgi:DNA-binding NtrC family response regulator